VIVFFILSTGSFTMYLSHRFKLWTRISTKVSRSIYGRLSGSNAQENGVLVIGHCIMTMLPLTLPCLGNNIWPRSAARHTLQICNLYFSTPFALLNITMFTTVDVNKFKNG
jgi:hypothetical protein